MFTVRYGLGLYIEFRLNCTTKLLSLCFPAVKGKACELRVILYSSHRAPVTCVRECQHTHTQPTYADLQLSSHEQNPLAFNMVQCSAEHSQCVSCCRQKNSRYAYVRVSVCVCSRACVRALASLIALLRRLVTEALT